jgi:hypothetical protein
MWIIADLARAEGGEAAITAEGRKAVALKRWENLNPDRLRYEVVFARAEALGHDQVEKALKFVEGGA